MYSSTTKNWFHTHPLFTLSRDEGSSCCSLPPEFVPLVLEASDHLKQQLLKRPRAANSGHGPAVQRGTMLLRKRKKRNWPVSTCKIKVADTKDFSLVVIYKKTVHQGKIKRSRWKNLKVNPWDHKSIWSYLLNARQVVEHIGFVPPGESMFVSSHGQSIWFFRLPPLPSYWDSCISLKWNL